MFSYLHHMSFIFTVVILCMNLAARVNVLALQNAEDREEARVLDVGEETSHVEFADDSFLANFYSFTVKDIRGNKVSLGKYRGKISLVVNVACECGYTDGHYKALVKLQTDLAPTDKFNVLAFPCNQFGAQEPGTNEQIEKFVKENYQVNFPMFAKVNVLDEDVPGAWQYLIVTSGHAPTWNFWKYLVNQEGEVISSWGPEISVEDIHQDILDAVQAISPEMGSDPHGGEL